MFDSLSNITTRRKVIPRLGHLNLFDISPSLSIILPMSLPSSSIPFRPWLWTRSQQSARLALPANTPRPQRQPFHSSRSAYLPARSPRARRVANRTTDYVSNDGLMRNTKHAAPIHVQESLLNFFQLGADDYFMSAKKEGILPEVVTKRVFFNFGVQLLKAQFTDYPTALSIRRISTGSSFVMPGSERRG